MGVGLVGPPSFHWLSGPYAFLPPNFARPFGWLGWAVQSLAPPTQASPGGSPWRLRGSSPPWRFRVGVAARVAQVAVARAIWPTCLPFAPSCGTGGDDRAIRPACVGGAVSGLASPALVSSGVSPWRSGGAALHGVSVGAGACKALLLWMAWAVQHARAGVSARAGYMGICCRHLLAFRLCSRRTVQQAPVVSDVGALLCARSRLRICP